MPPNARTRIRRAAAILREDSDASLTEMQAAEADLRELLDHPRPATVIDAASLLLNGRLPNRSKPLIPTPGQED